MKLSRKGLWTSFLSNVVNLCDKQTQESHKIFETFILAETLPACNERGRES